jgi:Fe(3+) dicitrate transport protein
MKLVCMKINHCMSGFAFAIAAAAQAAVSLETAELAGQKDPIRMSALTVEATSDSGYFIRGPFLPDVQGAKINAGKKTTVLDLAALPRITANNYRQALSRTSGLVLTEETSPLVSIGYRGLDPYRTQYTQVLKDGIPIHADQFGYPEAYYTPALDSVERLEFLRGGAALLYGPQPGGALNYVTRVPRADRRIGGQTQHTFGSNDYHSTFIGIDGGEGPWGYSAHFHRRESDGIRAANSTYRVTDWSGRGMYKFGPNRVVLTFETYEEAHGEPGGLTFATGPGAVDYTRDRRAVSRFHDRFELDRKAATVAWDWEGSSGRLFSLRTWAIDYARGSRRQRGGGFGVLPSGPLSGTNLIERKRFTNYGVDARFLTPWGGHQQHLVSSGVQVYRADSPLTESIGATPDAANGQLRLKSQRDILYTPVFAETLLRFGSLKITPGVRAEIMNKAIEEMFNQAKADVSVPLAKRRVRSVVPLLGLGMVWDLPNSLHFYGNVSESYRPPLFTEAVPQGGTTVVNRDLREGRTVQYEVGVRSPQVAGLGLDASVFRMRFIDQFAEVALPGGMSTIMNAGVSVYDGAEVSLEYDLLRYWVRPLRPTLKAFSNLMLLDARFTAGPLRGNVPQHAPKRLVRAGLILQRADSIKISLQGTVSGSSYGDDGNRHERVVPAYEVWDLIGEWRILPSRMRLIGGVNNLLNRDYYTRARNEGIDPSALRNFYLGAALDF